MELEGKVVVITGASKGLGKSLAEGFAREGTKLILSSRSAKDIRALADRLGGASYTADVTDERQVMNLAKFAVEKFGRIDVWINNAGIWIPPTPVEELDSKAIHQMVEVNLFGTIYGSKAVLIQMKKQNSGVIVNILSTSALEGRAGSSAYCASKYAAVGFTKSLRVEAKPNNIFVLAAYPGGMQTNLFDAKKPQDYESFMSPDSVAEKIVENLKQDLPEEELIIRRKQS